MAYVVEKAGRHYAVIYEGTDPVTGRERRRWRRCPSQADAEALARRLGTQRSRLREAGSLMTLGDYLLRQWLPAREAALTATTYARYITSIEHYLVPHLGRVQLRQLRSDQLTALYRRLATNGGHKGRPLAAKTIRNLHQILRLALEDAVEQELIAHNPADDIEPPDPRKRPSPRRRATSWTDRELGIFLDATQTSRYCMLFQLAAATGMRRGKLLGLRWSDVHLDTGRLEITQALTAIGYETSFSRLKTKTSRRCITVDLDTVKCLKAWRKQQTALLEDAGLTNKLGLVFTGSNGGPLHPHLASQAFARAQKGLAVAPIRFHDIRHTHATLLLRDRVPIKVVSERLGHSNPGVHHDHVPARAPGHARRRCTCLRQHPRQWARQVRVGSTR